MTFIKISKATGCLFLLMIMAPVCDENKSGRSIMQITSQSFIHESMIPVEFTCEGLGQSPKLSFKNVPDKTRSLALIMDDPDAPNGFVHWLVWNIDIKTGDLPKNASASMGSQLVQGTNSAGNVGYKGPCPPSGTHRYYFKLYALDTELKLPPSTTKDNLLKAMDGHIIGEAQLMGKYKKGK